MPKNEIKEQFEEKYNLYGDMLYKIAYLYLCLLYTSPSPRDRG